MPVLRHQDISTLCCRLLQPRTGTIWTIDMMGTCDMNHRQETCRTGNAGYSGTKEQIVLSLHDCCMLTALCRPHSRQCPGWWRQAHCYARVGGGLAPGARGIVSWRRACGGHQLTVRCGGDNTGTAAVSNTGEGSYCYTALLLWFLMLSE